MYKLQYPQLPLAGKYVLDKSIRLLDNVVVVIQTLQRTSFDEV